MMNKVGIAVCWVLFCAAQQGFGEGSKVEFTQAATVLRTYCAGCHNDQDREGDFSLSSFGSLAAGTPDGPVFVPGKPDESKLLNLITGKLEPRMPPEDEPQPSQEEIRILRSWLEQGAMGPSAEKPGLQIDAPNLPAATADQQHVSAACAVADAVAVGELGRVTLMDGSGAKRWSTSEISGKVNSLRLSEDGTLLAVGGGVAGLGGEANVIDAATGSIVQRFLGHSDSIYCASLDRTGKLLATGSYDRRIILWNVETGKPIREFPGHNGAIYDLDFDPSGNMLVTASGDQTIKLWHVSSGARLDTFAQPEGEQFCVRFSRDGGSVFAAGADRQIRKWNIVSRDKPAINPMVLARYAHEADVLQLVCLENDRLISSSSDREVKLWESNQLSPVASLGQTTDLPVGICKLENGGAIVVDLAGNKLSITKDKMQLPRASRRRPSNEADANISNTGNNQQLAAGAQNSPRAFEFQESEPNDEIANAEVIHLPAKFSGSLNAPSDRSEDRDLVRFLAREGEKWIFELKAAKGSPMDSRIEILHADGTPVLRTRLQAVRESYFTFRGKDSDTSDDFRMHKWEDMELDEYLYANGEVNRLWLYPRGPDSGFKVYPGSGKREAFFDTTPLSHALGEPAYVVRELQTDEIPLPNGLPVFPIYFENDDDASRTIGANARLNFVAPTDDQYFARIRDARGFSGPDFGYELNVRVPQPDFTISIVGDKMEMPPVSGREWSATAARVDGLRSEIAIELLGLPPGFEATNPLIIEAGQETALGTIYATDAVEASTIDSSEQEAGEHAVAPQFEVTLVASTVADGQKISKTLPQKLLVTIKDSPSEVRVRLLDPTDPNTELKELDIRPGETISATIAVDRNGNKSAIGFGKDDSGRNLPHGAFVDNIGLNGLLITEQFSEREFFITAAPKVQPGRRQFHLRSEVKEKSTTRPIWLNVLPAKH